MRLAHFPRRFAAARSRDRGAGEASTICFAFVSSAAVSLSLSGFWANSSAESVVVASGDENHRVDEMLRGQADNRPVCHELHAPSHRSAFETTSVG